MFGEMIQFDSKKVCFKRVGEKPPSRTTWWISGNMGIGYNTISAGIYDALHLQPSLSSFDAHLQVSWFRRSFTVVFRAESKNRRIRRIWENLGHFLTRTLCFYIFLTHYSYYIYVELSADTWQRHDFPTKSHGRFKQNHLLKHSDISPTKSHLKSCRFAQILSYGALGSLASLHARSHHLGERSGSGIPLPSCKLHPLWIWPIVFFLGSR